jgi:hypothetical protein
MNGSKNAGFGHLLIQFQLDMALGLKARHGQVRVPAEWFAWLRSPSARAVLPERGTTY